MSEISERIFDIAYSEFIELVNSNSDVKIENFKTHPYIDEKENYKYAVLDEAKDLLLRKNWKESEIGNGNILERVKSSIKTSVIYNYVQHDNNLIDWRKKDNFNKRKATKEIERLLFDFYKSRIKDDFAFEKFNENGFSYQLIAYLFFLKNPQKYLPISQVRFDQVFNSLEIDFKTSNNISWDNYEMFNRIIKEFKNHLSIKHPEVSILDAHSFLWIYGYKFDPKITKEKIESKKETVSEVKGLNNDEIQDENGLDTYKPKKGIDIENLTEIQDEIDYIELHRKQMEIGNLAEKIVLKDEIEFLEVEYPELANQVRSVANNPKLGFDILSFETNGNQKQIEVKAIRINNKNKSFILTRNELKKSKTYSNYYIYCVTELSSDNPKILRIKNPDLENEFSLEPLTYKVTFE